MVQKTFRFRPKELLRSSYAAKCILSCLRCGLLTKKSNLKRISDEANRPYVGCQSALLVGRAASSKFVHDPPRHLVEKYGTKFNPVVHFVASYYTRLAEYYRLASAQSLGLPRTVLPIHEMCALKEIIHKSLCTTLQRYFKISKTELVRRYGLPPGGYPVPNEDRPTFLKTENSFRMWPCVRANGCTLQLDPTTRCIQTPVKPLYTPRSDSGPKVQADLSSSSKPIDKQQEEQIEREYTLLNTILLNGGMMRRHTLYSKIPRMENEDLYERMLNDGRFKVRDANPRYPGFELTNKGIRWMQHVRPTPPKKRKQKR